MTFVHLELSAAGCKYSHSLLYGGVNAQLISILTVNKQRIISK